MGGTKDQEPPAGLAGIAVRSQRLIQCVALLLALSTLVGCAARQAFDSGEKKMQRQDYDAAEIAWLNEMYRGEVAAMDAYVERLLGHLDASGHARDTLVVFVSDHGEEFDEALAPVERRSRSKKKSRNRRRSKRPNPNRR